MARLRLGGIRYRRIRQAHRWLAGIADTGPLLPLLTNVPQADHPKIREAAGRLLEANGAAADL